MKNIVFVALLLAAVLMCASACSSLRWGNAVKASFDTEESDGWLKRKVPGIKTLSNIIPPPNENRIKWDQRLRRQSDLIGSEAPSL